MLKWFLPRSPHNPNIPSWSFTRMNIRINNINKKNRHSEQKENIIRYVAGNSVTRPLYIIHYVYVMNCACLRAADQCVYVHDWRTANRKTYTHRVYPTHTSGQHMIAVYLQLKCDCDVDKILDFVFLQLSMADAIRRYFQSLCIATRTARAYTCIAHEHCCARAHVALLSHRRASETANRLIYISISL